jgi:hypothetical protein
MRSLLPSCCLFCYPVLLVIVTEELSDSLDKSGICTGLDFHNGLIRSNMLLPIFCGIRYFFDESDICNGF